MLTKGTGDDVIRASLNRDVTRRVQGRAQRVYSSPRPARAPSSPGAVFTLKQRLVCAELFVLLTLYKAALLLAVGTCTSSSAATAVHASGGGGGGGGGGGAGGAGGAAGDNNKHVSRLALIERRTVNRDGELMRAIRHTAS
ncbi:unnamed protein product [Chrysodeixis includens]|uniref:Uncharacterized protein n=1 Tax=Chrysodeixis includens TaxID=689277 RepID=A0A9N8KZY5_CHRIL|nr:unnamed protein product [Chrysodeixis includens]